MNKSELKERVVSFLKKEMNIEVTEEDLKPYFDQIDEDGIEPIKLEESELLNKELVDKLYRYVNGEIKTQD